MPFEKGKPRPPNSGRKTGTGNKVKAFIDSVEVANLDEVKTKYPDPLVRLLQIGNDPSTPVQVQVHCHKEVAKYLHAQKREVAHSGQIDLLGMSDDEIIKLLEENGFKFVGRT